MKRLEEASLAAGVAELCGRDPALAATVERWGPPPLWARPEGFTTLARIVLEQQISLTAARAAFARLEAGLGEVTAQRLAASTPEELRALGQTRQKAGYLLDLARRVVDGELDLEALSRADDETARRALTAVRGIGPWTASIYLLMALRRPDVWPPGDLALAEEVREIRRLPERPSSERLGELAAAWSPWRAVAARILWHGYLSRRAERAGGAAAPGASGG